MTNITRERKTILIKKLNWILTTYSNYVYQIRKYLKY